MVDGEASLDEALDRLTSSLPKYAPEVWETLRPGVSDVDLEVLRETFDLYELPGEVVAFLRWADGQEQGAPWWPSIECGPLLSATRSVELYKWLCENAEEWQWCPLWLPIAHEGWYQAGIEIAPDRPGVVIDASWHGPARVLAPTLAAMLDVTADMVEAGIGVPPESSDARVWRAQRAALIDARPEWRRWPYDRAIATDVTAWPPHWRRALRH